MRYRDFGVDKSKAARAWLWQGHDFHREGEMKKALSCVEKVNEMILDDAYIGTMAEVLHINLRDKLNLE